MIVNRRVWKAKKGHMKEALALVKSFGDFGFRKARVYVSNLGEFDRFALELEAEDLAEYERLLEAANAKATPEFWERWNACTEGGGTNEIWRLV